MYEYKHKYGKNHHKIFKIIIVFLLYFGIVYFHFLIVDVNVILVVSVQHYIQGALFSVITIYNKNHKLIWCSQIKVLKLLENVLIGSA